MRTESHSSVNTYKTCPAKYNFHYSDQNRPVKASDAMQLGNLVHEAFAYALQGACTVSEMLAYIDIALIYNNVQDKARAIVQYYAPLIGFGGVIKPYQMKGKRIIEKRFDVDLWGIQVMGYIDAIIQDQYGNVVLVDWKTRAQLLESEQIALDSQLYMYAYVAKYTLGIPITKICQVQMKTTLPAKPKVLKSGKLSKTLGATTKTVFIDECQRLGVLKDVEIADYEHKFVDENQFLRMSYIDMGKMQQKTDDFVFWIRRIQKDELMLPVNNASVCKWCQYTDLCLDRG